MSESLKNSLSVFIILIGIAIYSISSFAYMYDKFVSKDTMSLILHQLDRIEGEVTTIRNLQNVIKRRVPVKSD